MGNYWAGEARTQPQPQQPDDFSRDPHLSRFELEYPGYGADNLDEGIEHLDEEESRVCVGHPIVMIFEQAFERRGEPELGPDDEDRPGYYMFLRADVERCLPMLRASLRKHLGRVRVTGDNVETVATS